MTLSHTDAADCLCESCVWHRAWNAFKQVHGSQEADIASAIAVLRAANAAREAELRAESELRQRLLLKLVPRCATAEAQLSTARAENQALREALRDGVESVACQFNQADESVPKPGCSCDVCEWATQARAALALAPPPPTDPEDAR